MDTNNEISPGAYATAQPVQPVHVAAPHSRNLVIALAVMGAAVAALATALVMSNRAPSTAPSDTQAFNMTAPPLTAPATNVAGAGPSPLSAPLVQSAPAAQRAPVMQPAPVIAQAQPNTRILGAPPAAVCHTCGVVESATAVTRYERPQGIAGTQITPGMAAGGLIGGLLGNQIGHGGGRTAATVLGAAGGAYAGNAVEKNMKKYTAYEIRVRMNDGTYHSFEQRTALANGTRVHVENGHMRVAS